MVDHNSHPSSDDPAGQSSTDAEAAEAGGERVAKALARAGVASRREVERLIAEGRVALNGQVLTTPAVKVGPGDILTVNGEVVSEAEPTRIWRYHKPVGLMTTHNDPKGRPTVFENLPAALPRVISVGRLDLNSEGLLLLTNDGGLARALELPATGLMRRYRARAYGHIDQAKLDRLINGITVDGVVYGPIEAKLDKAQYKADADRKGPANLWITVTLSEGKNREVRRVFEAIGLTVNRLIRLSYGPFALGTLAQGEVEEVGPRVIRELLSEHIAAENLPTGDRVIAPLKAAKRAAPGAGRRETAPTRSSISGEDGKPVYKPGWAKPKKKPVIQRGARPTRPPGVKSSASKDWRHDGGPEEKIKHYRPSPAGDTRPAPAPAPAPARGGAAPSSKPSAAKPRGSGSSLKPGGDDRKSSRTGAADQRSPANAPRPGPGRGADVRPGKNSGPYRATVKGPRPPKRPGDGGGPRR